MNDIVYQTKRFETISIETKHYPGRGSIEEIATLIDWRDGNEVRVASALVYATKAHAHRIAELSEEDRRRLFIFLLLPTNTTAHPIKSELLHFLLF